MNELLIIFGVLFSVGFFVLFLVISYNLYQKTEQQRREITVLSQEIAIMNNKIEKLVEK